MDPNTVNIEDLYDDPFDEQPPFWLDVLFILAITTIHITYSVKFTKFSLAYLNAKCEEKKSRTKWTTSRLYLYAIKSELLDNEEQPTISTKLWSQLAIVRHLVRILMAVLCWVVLILYITLQLNITFEYLVACVVNYEKGSFLALIIFPALIFVNIGVIRYIFYGITASWSINLDVIADEIAYEQQHDKAKERAFKGTRAVRDSIRPLSVWSDDVRDEVRDEINNETDTEDKTIQLLADEMNVEQTEKNILQRYKEAVAKFTSPYWMAVHWRLLTIFSCVLATILALPSISKGISVDPLTKEVKCVLNLFFNSL